MDEPIRVMEPKTEMVFPMSQHIGAPATPTVAVGDTVKMGQIIGEASGFISANIVSSVSGTVKKIEPRLTGSGAKATCVVIENDGEDTPVEGLGEDRDYTTLSKEEIRQIIKDAGIVGMGGAGFPTHIKLAVRNPKRIRYVLINGTECEPYMTSDYRRMLESPEELVEGLRIVLSLFERATGIFAIEDNKRDAITAIQLASGSESRMEVRVLETKYPQGAERQLIYATTGRKINSSMLPADVGCIVDNVDTVVAIYRAVTEGRPLMERIITVTGDAVANPRNFRVPIGMSYQELLDIAGGFKQEPEKIICGGPMMGFGMFQLDVPTTKTSTALLALTQDDVSAMEPSPCINCGRCVEACPGRIVPSLLATYAEHFDEEAFVEHNGMECCECGCCSFVCPAKRPLTQEIKSMRKIQLAKKKKK